MKLLNWLKWSWWGNTRSAKMGMLVDSSLQQRGNWRTKVSRGKEWKRVVEVYKVKSDERTLSMVTTTATTTINNKNNNFLKFPKCKLKYIYLILRL